MTLPAFLLDPLKFKNPVRINSKSTFFYSRHSSVGLLGSLTVTITGRFPCPTQLFNAYYCSPDYSYCVPFLRPLLFLLQKREAPLYILLSNSRARTGRNIFGQQQLNPTTLYNRLNRKFERSHNQTPDGRDDTTGWWLLLVYASLSLCPVFEPKQWNKHVRNRWWWSLCDCCLWWRDRIEDRNEIATRL